MKTKSKYRKKHKHKKGLNGMAVPAGLKAKLVESGKETGKDILVGVIGGGLAGYLLGKSSLLVGAGVTGYGHFRNKRAISTFGMGMMMGGGMSAAQQAMSGLTVDDIKARVISFKDGLLSKLYLDKVFKPEEKTTTQTTTTSGLGEGELDFSALSKFEQQVLQSGNDYQKKIDAGSTTEGLNSSYAEMIDEVPTHY
jgi:hypothetical protein